MTLTAYFRRTDPEKLRLALLSRRIARPLWQPFIVDREAPDLQENLRDYHQSLARRTEMAILDLKLNAKGVESYKDLRRRISIAHEDARKEAKIDGPTSRLWSLWRELLAGGREYLEAAEFERAEREKWFSPDLPERPDPGPVLMSYCTDLTQVMRLIEWAYIDSIGAHDRVHANIQIYTNEVAPPSLQDNQNEADIELVSGKVHMEISDSPFNPYPEDGVSRARRITIHLPFPCGLHTAFGLEGVLAHELGVHLYEQLLNDGGPLSRGALMSFAEGFIDSVITNLLRDAVDAQNGVPEELAVAEHVYFGSQKRYDDRLHLDAPQTLKSEQRANWRDEIQAGRRFYDCLVKLGVSLTENQRQGISGEAWARRVALKLNVLDLTPEYRSALVKGANMALYRLPKPFVLPETQPAPQLLAAALLGLAQQADLHQAGIEVVAFIDDTDGFVQHLP